MFKTKIEIGALQKRTKGRKSYQDRKVGLRCSTFISISDELLIFEDISVDEDDNQHYVDMTEAYRQACLNAINYMTKFGYSREQGLAILGTAPVQGHVSGIVDYPNACAILWLPTDIFEGDLMPGPGGPTKYLDGSVDIPTAPDL